MYKIGEFVACRVSPDFQTVFDMPFNHPQYTYLPIRYFEIAKVFAASNYYLILLPPDQSDIFSFLITQEEAERLKLETKYIGRSALQMKADSFGYRYVPDPYQTALACAICKERSPYSSANCKDGRFICFRCRSDTRNMIYECEDW